MLKTRVLKLTFLTPFATLDQVSPVVYFDQLFSCIQLFFACNQEKTFEKNNVLSYSLKLVDTQIAGQLTEGYLKFVFFRLIFSFFKCVFLINFWLILLEKGADHGVFLGKIVVKLCLINCDLWRS